MLVSSGADARIVVWAVKTGSQLHSVRPGAGGAVLALAMAPDMTLFAAHARGEIRRFEVTADAGEEEGRVGVVEVGEPVRVHETGVFGLCFDAEGDLWTASADGDVVCLGRETGWRGVERRIRAGGGVAGGGGGWAGAGGDMAGAGGDRAVGGSGSVGGVGAVSSWVRSVAIDDENDWIVSVGRDEEVRVWDRAVCFPPFPLLFLPPAPTSFRWKKNKH